MNRPEERHGQQGDSVDTANTRYWLNPNVVVPVYHQRTRVKAQATGDSVDAARYHSLAPMGRQNWGK